MRTSLEYLDTVHATLSPSSGGFILQGRELQTLEGCWADTVIVVPFPDMAKAPVWYESAAYQAIVHLRTDHLTGDVILVDRVAADQTPGTFARKLRAMLASQATAYNTPAVGRVTSLARQPPQAPGRPRAE